MKVAMLGWELPPFKAGGLGVHCLELTRGLARAGVEIDFYMPRIQAVQGDLRVAEHHDHARVVEVEANPVADPYETGTASPGEPADYDAVFEQAVEQYNRRLVERFNSTNADLLHCHDWITVPAALELRARTGLPLVFTVHSTEADRSGGLDPQGRIAAIERAGVHQADRVIAVSRYTKQLLADVYDAPPDRIVPIYNGVDLSRLHNASQRDYGNHRRTVLFLSRLVRQKGPLHFLAAARRVLEIRDDARFVVAGKGPMLPECIRYTLDHNIARNVRFAGFVPEENLADVYRDSAVYVLPSLSEPFGISILEAMGTGVPTIVSKTTGAGESLDHVLKVDFWDVDEMADLILGCLDSPVLRQALGSNGGAEVRKFSWADTCRETLDVYEAVVRERGGIEVTPP